MSSKTIDNETFASLAQEHLRSTGHYGGEIDAWAGPKTQSAYRDFAGIKDVPAPAPTPPASAPVSPGLPDAAFVYRLPSETPAALNAFYGAASSSPPYLDWFSFPHEGTRLYTRGGTLLKDHVGDARLDHRCHKLLTGRLTAALAEIYATLGRERYEKEGWHIYGGCHDYRQKRGGSGLSIHSWGIGIDINPDENPYAQTTTTFSPASIDIMEKHGFLSGGRAWGKDWMHFQAAIPSLSTGSHYARNDLPKHIIRA